MNKTKGSDGQVIETHDMMINVKLTFNQIEELKSILKNKMIYTGKNSFSYKISSEILDEIRGQEND